MKRKAPEPPTRTRGQLERSRPDNNTQEEENKVATDNAAYAPYLKQYCSHCGNFVDFNTYTSAFSLHYGKQNWDTSTGRWVTTKNGMPKKPLSGHDGLTIYTRLFELSHLDAPAAIVSHLLEPKFSHDHHAGLNPDGGGVYADEDGGADSDDDDDPEDDTDDYNYDTDDDVGVDGQVDLQDGGGMDPPAADEALPEAPDRGPGAEEGIDPFWLLARTWKSVSGTTDTDFASLLKLINTLPAVPPVTPDVPTTTLHTINVQLGLDKDLFDSICVCATCGSLYDREGCKISVNETTTRSRVCCEKSLLKRTSAYSSDWTPVLTYPCVDVETALASILSRQGMDQSLDHWKERLLPKGSYGDLYEGDVWKDFQQWKGVPFLSARGVAVMLNMDGFQPFKRRQYSVQGIYLAIMNLPRHLRYRRENMILVGLVPGGKEKIPLTHFISRLAKQLKQLWENISPVLTRRVALLAVACDVPAGRKICGLVSYSSPRGCSRCDCLYETEKNSNGTGILIRWDRPVNADAKGEFEFRTREDHVRYGKAWKKERVDKKRKEIIKNTGYRWSAFLILEYFDPSRMTVLDPLHNLWEGLFKDLLKQFLNSTVSGVTKLADKVLKMFETEVGRCRFPRSMGPVLGKIGHKMSRFTGHELKNMLNTFFLWLVDGHVTDNEYQLVAHLHEASRIADERIVTDDLIDQMHKHLVAYCNLYAVVYGGNALKPNHHFCRHLAGFMRDYGPTCAFWLFAFERYNGIMTSYNSRASVVESSMFRQYSIHSRLLQALNGSLSEDRDGSEILTNRVMTKQELDIARLFCGARDLPVLSYDGMSGAAFLSYRLLSLRNWDSDTYYEIQGHENFPGRLLKPRESFITHNEADLLRSSLASLHKKPGNVWSTKDQFMIGEVNKYRELEMCGVTYKSGTSSRMSHVLFKSDSSAIFQAPALVLYYISVVVSMDTGTRGQAVQELEDFDQTRNMITDCPWVSGFDRRRFTFARVNWFPAATVGLSRIHYEKWGVDLEQMPSYAFVPVARIASGFVPLLGDSTSVFSCGPLRGHFVF
jgi:hypothetical protein